MNKVFWISLPPIVGDVLVVAGDRKWCLRCAKATRAKDARDIDPRFSGVEFQVARPDGASYIFLWVGDCDWSVESFDTVAHEVSHVVDQRLARHGIPPGLESTEVRALLCGRLMGLILAGMRGVRLVSPTRCWGLRLPKGGDTMKRKGKKKGC